MHNLLWYYKYSHRFLLFYNPNIRPFEEYQKRLQENKHLCEEEGISFVYPVEEHQKRLETQKQLLGKIDTKNPIELLCEEYVPDEFFNVVKGLENEPERGQRCDKCFKLRLERAAQFAKEKGFTHFTSVLGISRYKNFDQVTNIALQVASTENIPYITTNWRKNGGEDLRAKLAKERGLYHQTYCGCTPRV